MKCLKCNIKIGRASTLYGLHQQCFTSWFNLSAPEEFRDLDPKTTSTISTAYEVEKKKDTFFHGRYLKYSARLEQTSYILKIQEARVPELPYVEYICNQIATLLEIEVPPYYLINLNNRITFVTRNFMQDHIGVLHHLYKFLPDGKKNHNCEEIIKVILMQTGKLSEIAKFIEICLFDSLIGNNDRHGRNLGIIETATVKKLAPMYDNPSFIGVEEEFILKADFNPSGSIWTKISNEPKPADYIQEFERLNYKNITLQFCKKLISQSSKIKEVILDSQMSDLRKDALIKLTQKRTRDFTHVQ